LYRPTRQSIAILPQQFGLRHGLGPAESWNESENPYDHTDSAGSGYPRTAFSVNDRSRLGDLRTAWKMVHDFKPM
jgi:hypothetical protein